MGWRGTFSKEIPVPDIPVDPLRALKIRPTKLSLDSLKAVYDGPGRVQNDGKEDTDGWSLDATLRLIEGIRTTAEREPGDVMEYLNVLEKRFAIRGTLLRQLKWLRSVTSPPKLGGRIVYASHPEATHRVLVYQFFGRLIREYSMMNMDDEIVPLAAYEPATYSIEPLARVDVKVPTRYLSGRYHDLEAFRDAVASSAERLAWEWYQAFVKRSGRSISSSASGFGSKMICRLTTTNRKIQRVWKMKNQTANGTAISKIARNTAPARKSRLIINSVGGE